MPVSTVCPHQCHTTVIRPGLDRHEKTVLKVIPPAQVEHREDAGAPWTEIHRTASLRY